MKFLFKLLNLLINIAIVPVTIVVYIIYKATENSKLLEIQLDKIKKGKK